MAVPTEAPESITVHCEYCGEKHTGTYHHDAQWGGARCYEVICPADLLASYYTVEAAL